MNAFLISALQHYGYIALWLVVSLAAAGVPVSGSLLLCAAGAFASLGDLNLFILFPVGVSAAVVGDNLTYFIGRRLGTAFLAWLARKKHFRWITPQSLDRARTYFNRRAGWTIFITRFFIVVLGGPINFLAGLEEYSYQRFLFWDVSGQILSVLISLGMGYFFAASWEEVAGLFGAFSSLVLAVIVALVLSVFLMRKIRLQKRARATEAANETKVATKETNKQAPQLLQGMPKQNTGPFPISD